MTSYKGDELARTKAFSRAVQIYNHIKVRPGRKSWETDRDYSLVVDDYYRAMQAIDFLIEYLKD